MLSKDRPEKSLLVTAQEVTQAGTLVRTHHLASTGWGATSASTGWWTSGVVSWDGVPGKSGIRFNTTRTARPTWRCCTTPTVKQEPTSSRRSA